MTHHELLADSHLPVMLLPQSHTHIPVIASIRQHCKTSAKAVHGTALRGPTHIMLARVNSGCSFVQVMTCRSHLSAFSCTRACWHGFGVVAWHGCCSSSVKVTPSLNQTPRVQRSPAACAAAFWTLSFSRSFSSSICLICMRSCGSSLQAESQCGC